MKKVLAVLVLSVAGLSAQSLSFNVSVTPFGGWDVCEDASVAPSLLGIFCINFTPGREQYLLSIGSQNSAGAAYIYTVTAILKSTGRVVTLSDVVLRQDNAYGYTGKLLDFGGVVTDIKTTIQELVISSVDVRVHEIKRSTTGT